MCRGAATICRARADGRRGAAAQTPLRARTVASGFTAPVLFLQDPTDRAVQFVVEQGGRIRVVRDGAVLPTDFLDLRSAMSSGGERGLLGMAFAPDGSGRFFVNFTNTGGRHRRRAVQAIREPARRRSGLALRSAVGRRRRLHRPAVRQSQRRQPRVRAGRLSLHRHGRRRLGRRSGSSRAEPARSCSARCCASTSTCPTANPTGYQIPRRQPVRGRRRAAGNLELRPAQSVAVLLRRSGARRHRRAGHRRRRPERVRGSRLRAARPRRAQLRLAQSRRGARQRHLAAAGVPAADRSDPRVHRTATASRSPAATCIAAARSARRSRGRYFFADYVQGRIWSLALTSTRNRRGDGVGRDRAHRRAVARRRARQRQLLRRRRRRRALCRQLLEGGGGQDHRAPRTVPAAPTGLRIIK